MRSWMHSRATWRERGQRLRLCAVLAAMLPLALHAQDSQPPQARLPVGFPGSRGGWSTHAGTNPAPALPAAPPPAAAAAPASQLPPTLVTQASPAAPEQQKPAHRALVQYQNGLLTVTAYNSSLNQILRAIIRETGLVVNGGVADERVYGDYGPARLQTLLIALLDGTNSNILYLPATADQPSRLTLTPRSGSATPPPPSATASNDLLPDGPGKGSDNAAQDWQTAVQPAPAPQPQPNVPAAAGPAPPATPHTAEEIYQEIMQMRADQLKQTQAAPTAAPAPSAPQ